MTSLESKVEKLLWDSLLKDSEHKDRRQTGYGTKTLKGLTLCIQRVIKEASDDDNAEEA